MFGLRGACASRHSVTICSQERIREQYRSHVDRDDLESSRRFESRVFPVTRSIGELSDQRSFRATRYSVFRDRSVDDLLPLSSHRISVGIRGEERWVGTERLGSRTGVFYPCLGW